MGISVFPPASSGGASFRQITQKFTSTTTWTAPADVTRVEVLLCGGGGGSAGVQAAYYSCGGGGSVDDAYLTVTPGTTYTITIGAGGSGGNNTGTAGSTGSTSSFGALFSVAGGTGSGATTSGAYTQYKTGLGAGKGGNGGIRNNTGVYAFSLSQQLGYAGYGAGGGGASDQNIWGQPANGSGRGGSPFNNDAQAQGTDAGANTGGGAGGVMGAYSASAGKNGGSGVCIIKYWSAL